MSGPDGWRERLRRRPPRCVEPGGWRPGGGRARVLVEHPDGLQLWSQAEALREAGYDVAVCSGPRAAGGGAPATRCLLLANGRCTLAEEADAIVSTPALGHAREILSALADRPAALVVEGPGSRLAAEGHAVGAAEILPYPVTAEALVAAVGGARAHVLLPPA